MKRLLMVGVVTAMLANGVMTVSADGEATPSVPVTPPAAPTSTPPAPVTPPPAAPSNTTASTDSVPPSSPGDGSSSTGDAASVKSRLGVGALLKFLPSQAGAQEFASKHKWCILGTAGLGLSVYLMNKTCPWFRRLIGCEEDNTPKRIRRLDPRVINSRS